MNNKYTILYIDDEPVNLQLFEINLSEKFNVITAISGSEGLNILEDRPDISVVVSDMKMPRMNGIEFITCAHQKYPDIKYFILTGFDLTSEIIEALNQKLIVKYFCKPLKVKEIISTIDESLSQNFF
jgi:two-component system, response regulator, stage 0 sporulation protein F